MLFSVCSACGCIMWSNECEANSINGQWKYVLRRIYSFPTVSNGTAVEKKDFILFCLFYNLFVYILIIILAFKISEFSLI